MPQVKDVETLNFGEQTFKVSEMSEQVQLLVEYFNKFNREEQAVRDELVKVTLAKEAVYRQIAAQVQKEQEDAAKAAEAPADEAAPAAETVQ